MNDQLNVKPGERPTSTPLRGLVVTGDDFGLTCGVNDGVLEAHACGILTSASLFANAAATDDGIRRALRTPTLAVGCHLTLVDGVPTLPPRLLPTLAPGGRFRSTWNRFIADALLKRIAPAEIDRELTAQIERLVRAGIHPAHLDSHKHVHAFPPVFAVVARLAARFGIRAVRVPFERPALRLIASHFSTPGPRRQALENAALGPWCRRDRALLAAHGLPPPRDFVGRVLTGVFTPQAFRATLFSLRAGVSELMTHPGHADEELERVRTRLRRHRDEEVVLLTTPGLPQALARAGIVLLRSDGVPSAQRGAA